jgi:pantoate--beta-alanine ligase
MKKLDSVEGVRECVASWRSAGQQIAFVPTMGNLHRGHMALVGLARQRAPRVAVSVFVNPTQFGPGEDLARYPRTLAEDTALLEQAGVDLLFAPGVAEMYPSGVEYATIVDVSRFSSVLEGSSRPGHFIGVATVVTKLLNIVTPDVAVFGEKDFQQLATIRQLVQELHLPVEIVGGPIVRDADGLALSSRNQYLSAAERQRAPQLQQVLRALVRRVQGGSRDWAALEADAASSLAAAGFVPDYVAIRCAGDLSPPSDGNGEFVVLAAARLGGTRLIDNIRFR